ncbi:LysR family transcriptional regulator [Planomicrobium sp. YIM 101495]|uniref:LysR family transcriptional regulator n=1 Tax=Planomicrobium sp. YIM 101495 TaxID=2665160 RepID=UPI0012B76202|nr:LysR family transcriptional regulator [Planomicrobium sp. YIM 101495]MTD31124.1 LysR family transcriptional regulator [Planomicrobium sp. YIM 101495]
MDHKLEIFVTTAEQKSFTRAAELMHLTPSAVSLSIKALEKKLEVKLFERTNKFVQLTTAGQAVFSHAKEILLKYDSMKTAIAELEPATNMPVSIGAAYTFGEYFLPGIIYAFSKRYPGITPDIVIQNSKSIAEGVHKQELDIGFIVEGEVGDLDVDIHLYTEEEMVLVAPPNHPLVKNSQVDRQLLEAETWIIREEGSGTREVTDKLFAQLGIRPKRIMSFGSSQTIKSSVALGLGVSYLSESTVRAETLDGTLSAIRLEDYPNKSRFHAVTHQSKFHSPSAQLFKEFLDSYALSGRASVQAKKTVKNITGN